MTPIDIEPLSDAAFQAIKPVILDRLTDQDIEDECDARGIGGADDDLDDLPGTDVDVIYHGDLALASEYWSRGGVRRGSDPSRTRPWRRIVVQPGRRSHSAH